MADARLDPASEEGATALGALLGASGARACRLSGGASSDSWLVEAGGRRLVAQRAAASDTPGLSRSVQAELMRRAGPLGVPVPPVVAVTSAEHPLGELVVTGFVEGEALAPRWLRDPAYAPARGRLTGQCAEALARLHAAPLDRWAGLSLAAGGAAEQLAGLQAQYRAFEVDVPAFEAGFAWARHHLPDEPASCLAHGDFRSGNLLVAPDGLRAVLDWELAHLSVPAEDLGWLCVQAWRFGRWEHPVGGFGTREALLDAYAAAGGARVDPATLKAWEMVGTLRWGLSCLTLVDDHLSGRVPSVERAAIGRRVSEVAADVLLLLAGQEG